MSSRGTVVARAERMVAAAGLLVALAAAGIGCAGSHAQRSFWTEVDIDRVRAIEVPAALKGRPPLPPLAVAVTVIDPSGAEGSEAAGGEGADLFFDPQILGDELVRTLAATKVFREVFPVPIP